MWLSKSQALRKTYLMEVLVRVWAMWRKKHMAQCEFFWLDQIRVKKNLWWKDTYFTPRSSSDANIPILGTVISGSRGQHGHSDQLAAILLNTQQDSMHCVQTLYNS